MSVLHGSYRGYPARLSYGRPDMHATGAENLTITLSVDAPTYGIVLWVTSRAARTVHLGGAPPRVPEILDWDEAFRQRFQVVGAPGSVLRQWLEPALQRALLDAGMSFASCDGGPLEVGLSSDVAADVEKLNALFALTLDLVSRLPTAIAAAGASAHLAAGSLAAHPEVVAHRGATARRVRRGVLLLVVALLVGTGTVVALVAVASLIG